MYSKPAQATSSQCANLHCGNILNGPPIKLLIKLAFLDRSSVLKGLRRLDSFTMDGSTEFPQYTDVITNSKLAKYIILVPMRILRLEYFALNNGVFSL